MPEQMLGKPAGGGGWLENNALCRGIFQECCESPARVASRLFVLVLLTDYGRTVGLYSNAWPKHTNLVKMYGLESTCQNECSQNWGVRPTRHSGKCFPS